MLFRRRHPLRRTDRIRHIVLPPGGWLRSLRYLGKRVMRLGDSPHAVAAGFACGVLVSWTPFIGFHFLMSVIIAYAIGGNLIASAIGTTVGNPLTFPVMWWLAYETGHAILGIESPGGAGLPDASGPLVWSEILPILKPMLIGAVPLGLVSGFVAYLIVRQLVHAYHRARRRRLVAIRSAASGPAPT